MKTNLPKLRLGKIILKEIEPLDYLSLFEIGSDIEVCRYLNWGPYKYPREALWTINEIFLKRPEEGIPVGYGIYLKDELIGMIDYHTYRKRENSCEIGYFLKRSYWGLGIMQKCLRKIIDLGFSYLELDKLICGHLSSNLRSKATILACGFKYEREALCESNSGQEIGYYYSIYKDEYEGGR